MQTEQLENNVLFHTLLSDSEYNSKIGSKQGVNKSSVSAVLELDGNSVAINIPITPARTMQIGYRSVCKIEYAMIQAFHSTEDVKIKNTLHNIAVALEYETYTFGLDELSLY